jgi:peptidoglycan/LPS O-acetylase OafA/YrhL
MSTVQYRPEIDGLRAISVSAVIIFHASPATLPGGVLGVDIFFVISGYLITSIILEQHDQKAFRLVEF